MTDAERHMAAAAEILDSLLGFDPYDDEMRAGDQFQAARIVRRIEQATALRCAEIAEAPQRWPFTNGREVGVVIRSAFGLPRSE